eukprot:1154234-Pelagomonas_calceolata.AAC.10
MPEGVRTLPRRAPACEWQQQPGQCLRAYELNCTEHQPANGSHSLRAAPACKWQPQPEGVITVRHRAPACKWQPCLRAYEIICTEHQLANGSHSLGA